MKQIISVLLFSLLWDYSCAQNDNPKFFPPSPNAYALGKYGDIPVSLYTGVPNITIPIYTVNEKGISIPISLSYHGSGIKVDETASDVGLGWALNAGGVITRSIRGKAEYLLNGVLWPRRADIPICTNCLNGDASTIDNFVNQNHLRAIVDGQFDGEPDIFYYNFNGRSGKFCFDKNGIPRLNKDEAIEISWIAGATLKNETFIIKDEMGFIYEFSDRETTYSGNEGLTVSAWYLSKITSPTGNVVTFTYDMYTYKKTDRSYSTEFVNIPVNQNTGTIYGPTITTYTSVAEVGMRIKEINSPKEKIKFSYQGGRLDVPPIPASGAVRLEKVIIENNLDGTAFKSFNLYASYFVANNGRKYNGPFPNDNLHLNYRLRLDSVKEVSLSGNITSAPYKFYYLGDDDPATDDPYNLPYRLSPQQDYWGYFNFSTNPHILPGLTNTFVETRGWFDEFSPSPNSNASAIVSLLGGANRNTNPIAIKANSLFKIEYPTGGRTVFAFEPNDYSSFVGGMRVKKVQNFSFNEDQPIETIYSYTSSVSSNLNPEQYSFEYYYVDWNSNLSQPIPSQQVLNMFGLPVATGPSKTVKVSAWPTAILGVGSDIGHSTVTVQQPGKGWVINSYSAPGDYPDYFNTEAFTEETQDENALLGGLYFSEAFQTVGSLFAHKTKNIDFGVFPYNELYSNDWKRGILTERRTYDQESMLLKSETFEYYKTLKSVIPGYKVQTWGDNTTTEHLYSKYLIPQTWSALKSSTITEYGKNGQGTLVSETKFYYDNQSHLQTTRTEMTNSVGKKETRLITYPLDYPSGTAFIDSMKANHLVAYPIEQAAFLTDQSNNFIKSGSITEYNNNATGLPLKNYSLESSSTIPVSTFKFSNRSVGILPPSGTPSSFSIDQRYKPSYFFNLYDGKGNLLEAQKAQDRKEAYLWGYNGEYPIAKVINASHNEIFHDNFEESTGWDGSLTAYDNSMRKTGEYSGRIDKSTSGEQTSHSTKWLNISLTAPKKFRYSTWVYSNGPSAEIFLFMKRANETGYFSYVTSVQTNVTNNWVLIEGEYNVPADVTQLGIRLDNNGGGTVWFDDVRLHPSDAQMKTYTYKPLVGMTSETDANGRTIYYSYDAFGRLEIVKDKDGKILKKYCYNYAGQQTDCSVNITAQWTATGNYMCEESGGNYTGNRLREERDNNPNSSTYNQVQWVYHEYNTTICPIPVTCDVYSCDQNGDEYRCVYGACEAGFRVNTDSYYDWQSNMYICVYHYEWSDGEWSGDYYEYNWGYCPI